MDGIEDFVLGEQNAWELVKKTETWVKQRTNAKNNGNVL
jgi:hypothetical protein